VNIAEHRAERDRERRMDALAAEHLALNTSIRQYAVRNRINTPAPAEAPARDESGKFTNDHGARGTGLPATEPSTNDAANKWLRNEPSEPFNPTGPMPL